MKNVIEVKNLTKKYKELKAIDDLSFEVYEGEILGLLGPNGSGKSTTINCLLSLLNFNKGTIKIFGKTMKPSSYDIKEKIGVVFQDIAVFEELNVIDNINYFCGLYIKDKDTRKKYVLDAINLVGLENYKKFYPKQLSGGLLRRLNIACGIAHKPKLIFLDEPTVAVDPQSRNNILEGIKKLRDEGSTIVYTTHYMEEVEVTVEVVDLENKYLEEIKNLKHVDEVKYDNNILFITYKKGKNNLIDLIDYLKINKINYTKIFSERPTLNDVFLELTGKELRD